MKFRTSIAAAAVACAPVAALATVVSGGVTSGGGAFVILDPSTAFSIGNNTFQDLNLYAFDEEQNITIASPLAVDVGSSPPNGEIVASHYVAYDPGPFVSQEGFVVFDAPIIGIATSRPALDASDVLANTAVTYLSPSLRGLEGGDSAIIDPSDPFRLLVDWTAGSPGDYIRVFTEFSPGADMAPVPLPAGGLMLLSGLAAFGLIRRRRR